MDDRASRSRTQEINAYKKRAYKRISLEIKKADYERIRAAADVAGEPVSAYIKGRYPHRCKEREKPRERRIRQEERKGDIKRKRRACARLFLLVL